MATVITEELKGIHSFRGVGFIKVEEMNVAVCGSTKLNFARSNRVSYLSEHITRVQPEEEFVATFDIKFDSGNCEKSNGELWFPQGSQEGIYYPHVVDGSIIVIRPPFKIVTQSAPYQENIYAAANLNAGGLCILTLYRSPSGPPIPEL